MKWKKLEVSSSNRPETFPEERILFILNNIGLYDGKSKVPYHQNGNVYLTSFRICYIDHEYPKKYAAYIEHKSIDRFEMYGGFLKSSPKLTLYLKEEAQPEDATHTAKTWICPICYFANPFLQNYSASLPPPACLTCGMTPEPSVLAAPQTVDSSNLIPNQPSAACPRCTFHNHPSLNVCEMCGERLISKNIPPQLIPRTDSPDPASGGAADAGDTSVKLSFRSGGEEAFLEKLQVAMQRKEWSIVTIAETSMRGPGISGLERAGVEYRRKNEVAIGGAFEDLDALMARAKEMVALAESFAAQVALTKSPEAKAALERSSKALGLNNGTITKDMAGEIFHAELARQLADFLERGVLKQEGGMITLIDLFALYNRARGVDLVSPADLYQAAGLFQKLRLPMRIRVFKSGVIVVQDSSKTDEAIARSIVAFVKEQKDGVFAKDVAHKFGWSVGIATEELELAESNAKVCRDVTAAGIRYFENLISSAKI